MSTASGRLDASIPATRRAVVATRILVVAFLVAVLLGLRDAGRIIRDLDGRAEQARSSRSDPADVAGGVADAFRLARSLLREGDRFTLVLPAALGRDQIGFYRLVGLSYLYPAVAVPGPAQADFVMVFGEPSASVEVAFSRVGVVSGVWLGRRRQ